MEGIDLLAKLQALERRVDELVKDNDRRRDLAAEAQKAFTVRSEMQRLGVCAIDLLYRGIERQVRADLQTGAYVGYLSAEEPSVPLREFLERIMPRELLQYEPNCAGPSPGPVPTAGDPSDTMWTLGEGGRRPRGETAALQRLQNELADTRLRLAAAIGERDRMDKRLMDALNQNEDMLQQLRNVIPLAQAHLRIIGEPR